MEATQGELGLRVRPLRHLRVVPRLGPLSNVQREVLQGQDCRPGTTSSRTPTTTQFWQRQAMRPYLDARDGADAERRRLVGPGGLLRPGHDLRRAREARQREPELPRRRPVEPRRLARRPGADARARSTSTAPTGEYFRAKIQAPFFAYYLKDKGTLRQPEAHGLRDGQQPRGERHDAWPPTRGRRRGRSTSSRTASSRSTPPTAAEATTAFDALRVRPGAPGAVPPAADRADVLPRARAGPPGWSRTSASCSGGPTC